MKLSVIPRLVDIMLPTRIEFKTDDYKEIKNLYDKIINNLVSFFEEQNISDPVEIFTIYQFMYRNGYLSFNHNFNYDIDMKDLSRLNGTDLIRSTGVCKIITSFLTDVYKKMDYDSCNYFVKKIAKVISITNHLILQ